MKQQKNDKKIKRLLFLNYIYKDFKYSDEELEILRKAKELFTHLGASVITIDFELDDLNNDETLLIEFKHDINAYFSSLKESVPIKSLENLIDFNKQNQKRCLVYGQSIFEASQKTSGILDDSAYKEIKTKQMKIAAPKLENTLKAYHLDAAISTMRNSYAPIYGNPTISVPAKPLIDLNPISMVFFGKKYDDENLITIAHHYETHTNLRIAPKLKG